MKTNPRLFLIAGASLTLAVAPAIAATSANAAVDHENFIALYPSDYSEPSIGLAAVNRRLSKIGVRVSQVPVPPAVAPTLRASRTRAITSVEVQELLRAFRLSRRDLLSEIANAGRTPAMQRGGFLSISEQNIPAYPKIYDMRAMDRATTKFVQRKFGLLHVNSSEVGVGIDEVMTIVSGGPYTWFFVFPDNVVGKLRFGVVGDGGKAWRISYPGLVPHGGFFDASHGLVVAHAHGPRRFVMRYEDPTVQGAETLNDNPWVDFGAGGPVLLDRPRQLGARSQ